MKKLSLLFISTYLFSFGLHANETVVNAITEYGKNNQVMKPLSINEISQFSDEFINVLNEQIRNPDNVAKTDWVHTKVWKDAIDKTVKSHGKGVDVVPVTNEQLIKIRNIINAKTDAVILLKKNGMNIKDAFGEGKFNGKNLTLTIPREISVVEK